MSYHLVTGRGATRLMLNHRPRYTLYLLATNCLFNTLEAAEYIEPNLELMEEKVPAKYIPAIELTEKWSDKTISHTKKGLAIAQNMAGSHWKEVLADLDRSSMY